MEPERVAEFPEGMRVRPADGSKLQTTTGLTPAWGVAVATNVNGTLDYWDGTGSTSTSTVGLNDKVSVVLEFYKFVRT